MLYMYACGCMPPSGGGRMRAPGSHAMHAMFICGFVCVRACTTGPNVIGWDLGFGAFAPAQHLTAFAARGKLIVWTLKINLSRTLKVFDVGAVLWGGIDGLRFARHEWLPESAI